MVKNFITGLSAGFEDMAAVATEVSQGNTGDAWINGLGGGKDFITYRGVYGTPWGMAMSIPDRQIILLWNKEAFLGKMGQMLRPPYPLKQHLNG